MEKYGRIGQATGDNIIRRMRLAYCINTARIQTHNHNISHLILRLTALHGNNGWRTRHNIKLHIHCLSCLFPYKISTVVRKSPSVRQYNISQNLLCSSQDVTK
jgi:hypothetical protein